MHGKKMNVIEKKEALDSDHIREMYLFDFDKADGGSILRFNNTLPSRATHSLFWFMCRCLLAKPQGSGSFPV